MKKKKCPQCKNLILVTAPTCLFCGRPNKYVTANYVKRKWDKDYKENKIIISRKKLFFLIVILVILFISLFK